MRFICTEYIIRETISLTICVHIGVKNVYLFVYLLTCMFTYLFVGGT